MFELDSNDPAFSAFHDFVDDICKGALDSCYGRFAELTTPIITQVCYVYEPFCYYLLFTTISNLSFLYVN